MGKGGGRGRGKYLRCLDPRQVLYKPSLLGAKNENAFWCVRSLFFVYSKCTAFSDLRSLLFFCVKNAVFSRKCDPCRILTQPSWQMRLLEIGFDRILTQPSWQMRLLEIGFDRILTQPSWQMRLREIGFDRILTQPSWQMRLLETGLTEFLLALRTNQTVWDGFYRTLTPPSWQIRLFETGFFEMMHICISFSIFIHMSYMWRFFKRRIFVFHFSFFTHMSHVSIYEVSPAIWLADLPSCKAKTLTLDTFQPNTFIPAILRHRWLLLFYATFIDLALGWKGKPLGFMFSFTFQLNGMKFGVVMKQFLSWTCQYCISGEIDWIKGEKCCFCWLH